MAVQAAQIPPGVEHPVPALGPVAAPVGAPVQDEHPMNAQPLASQPPVDGQTPNGQPSAAVSNTATPGDLHPSTQQETPSDNHHTPGSRTGRRTGQPSSRQRLRLQLRENAALVRGRHSMAGTQTGSQQVPVPSNLLEQAGGLGQGSSSNNFPQPSGYAPMGPSAGQQTGAGSSPQPSLSTGTRRRGYQQDSPSGYPAPDGPSTARQSGSSMRLTTSAHTHVSMTTAGPSRAIIQPTPTVPVLPTSHVSS